MSLWPINCRHLFVRMVRYLFPSWMIEKSPGSSRENGKKVGVGKVHCVAMAASSLSCGLHEPKYVDWMSRSAKTPKSSSCTDLGSGTKISVLVLTSWSAVVVTKRVDND